MRALTSRSFINESAREREKYPFFNLNGFISVLYNKNYAHVVYSDVHLNIFAQLDAVARKIRMKIRPLAHWVIQCGVENTWYREKL